VRSFKVLTRGMEAWFECTEAAGRRPEQGAQPASSEPVAVH
jgi:hypothetical protein